MLLVKSTTAYVVGHWHISRKVVPEHFSFQKKEVRDGFCQVEAASSGKLPMQAYSWLVEHFSHASDYVVDLFSADASATIASMKNSRNGIYFGYEEDQDNVRSQLASYLQPRRALSVVA